MKRGKSEHIEKRNAALYDAYKKACRECMGASQEELIEYAMKSRQPRMWVSFYGVYRILLRIMYGSREAPKQKSMHNLESDIRKKYEALRCRRAFKDASAFFMASFIMSEHTVGFYVSRSYASKVIRSERKRRQELWKK